MSLKLKLVSTISAFFLVLGLLIMGVWSAPSATINLGGSLTFTATDVNATVTGDVSGANNTVELPDLQFTNTTNVEEVSALWSNKELEFDDEGSEISILVTITNNATDRPLYASIEDKYPTITNITKGMTKLDAPDAQSGTVYQEDVIEIPANQTGNTNVVYIKLTMSVTDVNESLADDLVYGYDINLNNDEPESEVEKLAYTYDAINKTASVKMLNPSVTKGEIYIPETVIGDDGQNYTVTAIDAYAFFDMEGLALDPDTPNVDTIEKQNALIAKYTAQITSVRIGENVISIGEGAFFGCPLTEITISDSVTSIGKDAFRYCSGLTEITIPASVTSINSSAFAHCTGLEKIEVADGNEVYEDRDSNAIIEEESNTLIAGCKNTEIPDSVTSIGEDAFFGCRGLTKITIPANVKTIMSHVFYECSELTEITIPSSVTSIGQYAFYCCDKLATVNYTGTTAQWEALKANIDNPSNSNDYLLNAKIVCSDGTING